MSLHVSSADSSGMATPRRRFLAAAAGLSVWPAWAWGQDTAALPEPAPAPAPAAAPEAAPAPKPRPKRRAAKAQARHYPLAPGKFFWMPEIAPSGPVVALVNLHTQHVQLYRNGLAIGFSSVSTGKPGHGTPVGRFTVLERRRHHHSNLYSNAPMPWMVRLTWDGIAFHGGRLPGYPASHGCVRLPMAFAPHLFGTLSRGDAVAIVRQQAERYPADLSLLAPIDPLGQPTLLPQMLSQPEYWAEPPPAADAAPTAESAASAAAAARDRLAAQAADHASLQGELAASGAMAPAQPASLPPAAAQRPADPVASARARSAPAPGTLVAMPPLTLLVSQPQQRLFVMRDGAVLAAAAVPAAALADLAWLEGHSLFTWADAGAWQAPGASPALNEALWAQLLPASPGFSARLRAALTPGSTLLISPLPAVNDLHLAVWKLS